MTRSAVKHKKALKLLLLKWGNDDHREIVDLANAARSAWVSERTSLRQGIPGYRQRFYCSLQRPILQATPNGVLSRLSVNVVGEKWRVSIEEGSSLGQSNYSALYMQKSTLQACLLSIIISHSQLQNVQQRGEVSTACEVRCTWRWANACLWGLPKSLKPIVKNVYLVSLALQVTIVDENPGPINRPDQRKMTVAPSYLNRFPLFSEMYWADVGRWEEKKILQMPQPMGE